MAGAALHADTQQRLFAAPLAVHREFMAARPAELRLPREDWPAHPAFATQTLLLRSHESFRRAGRELVAELSGLRTPDRRVIAAAHSRYNGWMAGMGSHESYEERKLYPYLCRRFDASFSHLQTDHQLLHECEDAVHETLNNAELWKTRDERSGAEVMREAAEAMRLYVDVLLRHLEAEEEVVIPMLLALTPEEFRTYYDGRINDLLAMLDRKETCARPQAAQPRFGRFRSRFNCCDVPAGSTSCCR